MRATVGDIMREMERIAPAHLAMEGDNVGLMMGDPQQLVDTVMLAMNARMQTLDQAIDRGAQLLLTHHPLLYRPAYALRADTPLGALVARAARAGVAILCAHTNFDASDLGPSATLAGFLGLAGMQLKDYIATGTVPAGTAVDQIAQRLKDLGTVQHYGRSGPVSTICVCAGSGSGMLGEALERQADLFICGEIKYHDMLDFIDNGIAVLTVGHDESERPALQRLANHLQNCEGLIQYKLRCEVAVETYRAQAE